MIYSNDNKSITDFSNIIFNYVDKDLKEFEISDIRASTINGLKLNTTYIDESFFDKNNDLIKVYPNPVENNINILSSIGSDLKVVDLSIYNIQGIRVYNRSRISYERLKTLDLSAFSSGLYFIKINILLSDQSQKVEVFKFIKK